MTFHLKPAPARPAPPFWERHKLPEPITIAVILFPGLLSERVAALFADSPPIDGTLLIATALALTLVNLAITLLLALALPNRPDRMSKLLAQPLFLVAVTAVSIGVGILWARIDSTDALYKAGLTDKRSRADLFSWAARRALDGEHWARVTTSGGAVYHGLLSRHDSSENGGLYLLGPKLEMENARKLERIAEELEHCKTTECRIPVACIDVGTKGVGTLYIPRSQIVTVEFRPAEARGAKRIYSCDLITERPPAGGLPVKSQTKP